MTARHLIIEARRRAGLTQRELAERLGTHQSVVARWETGRTHPDFDTVVEAIKACGLELEVAISSADDHDLALIRRELRVLPYQRLERMVEAVTSMEKMTAVASGG
jgi:transcriptional regulator with XRE-family HTH domain